MLVHRTLVKGVAAASLLLLVAGPASAATTPDPGPVTRGTAVTSSVPLVVEVGDVPVELGRTALTATTDEHVAAGAPWSTVALTLADVAGQKFGEVVVASDDTTSSPGTSIDETTPIGAVAAETGNLFAIADDVAGSATAALTTLKTDATVLDALGLSVTITDVVASVDDTGAAATHSLALAGIDLDLAHVLGSVLATLPLQDLVDLADQLGVDVPANLDAVDDLVAATDELVAAVTAAVTAADAVDTAADALLTADAVDPLADFGDIAAYEDLLTALRGLDPLAVTDTTTILGIIATDVDYQALECGEDAIDAGSTLDAVQMVLDQMITCVDAHLLAYGDALTALADELVALEQAVEDYVGAVAAVMTAATAADAAAGAMSVSDILADIEALLADLLAADLLTLGDVDVTQQVRAVGGQLDASSASHICQVTTLAVLGGDPVEIADCDGASDTVAAVVETITTTLQAVLDTVGGVDAGDGVTLEVFGTVEDSVSEAADGSVHATSVMEVLALTVPDVTITPCDVADGLVCALGLDLDGTLTTVLGTLTDAITDAQTVASDALLGVSELLAALASTASVDDVDAAAVQATVDTAVLAITGALDGLLDGLGELGTGGGVTVPGARVVVDPELDAEHQVLAAGTPGTPAPAPAPAPGGPPLPNTGGGAAMLAVLALGAGAWLWRRRED